MVSLTLLLFRLHKIALFGRLKTSVVSELRHQLTHQGNHNLFVSLALISLLWLRNLSGSVVCERSRQECTKYRISPVGVCAIPVLVKLPVACNTVVC